MHPILRKLLEGRGVGDHEAFLAPDYSATRHDPFLLPDMRAAVDRLVLAKQRDETVVIYGDYDIDGLTATSVLLEAFAAFGIRCTAFIPNRFVEGYGLSEAAIEKLAAEGAQLIVTVDCGSLSHKEIARAAELGVDVIVTDHHSVADTMPAAIATINPKRIVADREKRLAASPSITGNVVSEDQATGLRTRNSRHDRHGKGDMPVTPTVSQPVSNAQTSGLAGDDGEYPFIDLAGVGVAFKLVQALQTALPGLENGQEKWLLDLVALGTVCDVVELTGENRNNVYWGLQVMKKTRRPGLKALMAVSGVTPENLSARSLGFGLGPRLNASGRLETAKLSLDLINESDPGKALDLAEQLDAMNKARRTEQDRIFQEAIIKAEALAADPVLIVSDPSWSHGIIGIVAAKLLERYHKPTFVLQEVGEQSKGSARSYGDFSAVAAIKATEHLLIKGGGHKLAAGVTIETAKIDEWRRAVNDFYRQLALSGQSEKLLATADLHLDYFDGLDEALLRELDKLEPYGNGNPTPIFCIEPVTVVSRKLMGAQQQHVKYSFVDGRRRMLQTLAFNAADIYTLQPGEQAKVWCELMMNEWMGRRTVEGRLVRLEGLD